MKPLNKRFAQLSQLTLSIIAAGISAVSFAAPGDFDTTFNGAGYDLTAIKDGASADGVAVDQKGRVVSSGSFFVSDGAVDPTYAAAPILTMHRSDGSRETAFGSGGILLPAIYPVARYLEGTAVTVDSKNRIVLALALSDGFYLYRYDSAGNLDLTLNGTGMGDYPGLGNAGFPVIGITTDDKDRIIIAQGLRNATTNDWEFVTSRILETGSYDTSFNTFGTSGPYSGHARLRISPPGAGIDRATGVTIQYDGKIVVGGRSGKAGDYDFAVARYMPDGTIDTTFAGVGYTRFPMNTGNDFGRKIKTYKDRIYIAGTACEAVPSGTTANCELGLARLKADGALDAGFGSGGKVVYPINDGVDKFRGSTFDLAIDYKGRAVVAGSLIVKAGNPESNAWLARFDIKGNPDASFGIGGFKVFNYGYSVNSASAIALDKSYGLHVAGTTAKQISATEFYNIMAVGRHDQ